MRICRAGVLLALLLAGCASEKGIIDRDGYQLDTRHPAQAAYPRIKVLVIHYTAGRGSGLACGRQLLARQHAH